MEIDSKLNSNIYVLNCEHKNKKKRKRKKEEKKNKEGFHFALLVSGKMAEVELIK